MTRYTVHFTTMLQFSKEPLLSCTRLKGAKANFPSTVTTKILTYRPKDHALYKVVLMCLPNSVVLVNLSTPP